MTQVSSRMTRSVRLGLFSDSCAKAGRTRSSHRSQIDGTTRAVAWNRGYLRTCRFEFGVSLWQLFNGANHYHISMYVLENKCYELLCKRR